MLAAGVPVFGYDAPGPHMMLGPSHLVKVGARTQLASRVAQALLSPQQALVEMRTRARTTASHFRVDAVASRVEEFYAAALERLRSDRV